ncbi:MAG: threonine synthase [Candidatus Cloacimonadaceae bacterium]|nr:threonine synthase [Candidatus Cloacimonadaceae bacterium]MDP3113654.1 threonine synthase [Candidatus Cloacimonadaceae bacterium]
MRYYSTNLKSARVSFREALIKGLADDGGLYMPETIPTIGLDEIMAMKGLSYPEIAFQVAHRFLADEISAFDLKSLIDDAYDHAIPLEHVCERRYVMRLDQGPTASFKDFAARLMGRLMQYYLHQENRKLLILTATSGDTGSAIANAFYGLENIKVVVLYPELEVTARQRKQMSTLGKNIELISIDGKFDDCQALVKRAFTDPAMEHLKLSSANSINIGRLIPQTMYYFYAYARLYDKLGEKIVFSVPSGNFGDLMGGLIAKRMGLPVHKFVVATNSNDEYPVYYNTGIYKAIAPSRNCISSAMNVGHPSNVARLIALYGGRMDEKGVIHKPADMEAIHKDMYAVSIGESETAATISSAWKEHKLLLEPHGAVGWAGLSDYLINHPEAADRLCVSLETAHPAKFPEKIKELLGFDPALPPSLQNLEDKPEYILTMHHDYDAFAKHLLENYQP